MNYNGPWEIAKIVLMADFVGEKKKKKMAQKAEARWPKN